MSPHWSTLSIASVWPGVWSAQTLYLLFKSHHKNILSPRLNSLQFSCQMFLWSQRKASFSIRSHRLTGSGFLIELLGLRLRDLTWSNSFWWPADSLKKKMTKSSALRRSCLQVQQFLIFDIHLIMNLWIGPRWSADEMRRDENHEMLGSD